MRSGPIQDAHVTAFHPGPPSGALIPGVPYEAPRERLARFEREMVDLAIARSARSGGQMGQLAVQIIALRAEVAQ